jgi:hypothetical protein
MGHNGVDWGLPEGTPLYASVDGTIGRIGFENNGYGNFVRINMSDGGKVICAHMSQYIVKLNQKIKAGDLIGYSGNTGFSTTPHVHFEYRDGIQPVSNGYNGAVDPSPFLESSIIDPVPDEPSPAEEPIKTGDVVVVAVETGANLRNKCGNLLGLVYKNTELKITGNAIDFVDGLKRFPIQIDGYIAQYDINGQTLINKK